MAPLFLLLRRIFFFLFDCWLPAIGGLGTADGTAEKTTTRKTQNSAGGSSFIQQDTNDTSASAGISYSTGYERHVCVSADKKERLYLLSKDMNLNIFFLMPHTKIYTLFYYLYY